MARKNKFDALQEAQRSRQEAKQKALDNLAMLKKSNSTRSQKSPRRIADNKRQNEPALPPSIVPSVKNSLIDLYRDDEVHPITPSSTIVGLADLYLHAAKHRTRHIAFVWPATLKTLTLVHALATVARWHEGDKQGIRGLLFPAKTNAFHPLNHIHFDRAEILRIANELVEVHANSRVKRSMPDKDAFLYSLSNHSLVDQEGESFNPTIGELLPSFLATPDFTNWQPCGDRLLALIRAKLAKRSHAKALKETNCAIIGDPTNAPDAIFALDGRMSEEELHRALATFSRLTPPEVVLISASRAIRLEARGWRRSIARFCMMLEEVFNETPPGVVIVTDEPYAAYQLKNELWKRNEKRRPELRWKSPHAYKINGFPSTVPSDGLLPLGVQEKLHPLPREFDVRIVDADVAKIATRLIRVANSVPGGRDVAKPITDAAAYMSRIAALPCGVRHLSEYLAGQDVTNGTRAAFDWPTHIGAINEFDCTIGVGEDRTALIKSLEQASRLFENYYDATPFAHMLAQQVASASRSKKRQVAIVFTSALYRRLAESFLSEYDQYPDDTPFEEFKDRVYLISAAHLEDHLSGLEGSTLIFAGLNENCLRLLVTDDRVPAHSKILLTQSAGQFLRTSLNSIIENFIEFKSFKPRIETILRQLKDLPENSSILSTSDYAPPTFRVELSSDLTSDGSGMDPDSWFIKLDNGVTQFRRDTSEVYVYDPTSHNSSNQGFKSCQVKSLETGDKLFFMSAELREMVEQALIDVGIPIHTDKTFESALRSYHDQVQQRLARRFPNGSLLDKVRSLREEMLSTDPSLESQLPKEPAMRLWIDLGKSPNTPFEMLRPQAPRREPIFKIFADVLGFSSLEAAYQWQRVIMAVRNSRRFDGRHVSDIYAYMLLQPESAMANSSIKHNILMRLFQKARESMATVESVGPIKDLKL